MNTATQIKYAYNTSNVTHLLTTTESWFSQKAGIIYSVAKLFSVLNVCQLRHAARKRRFICEKHITEVSSGFSAPGLIMVRHAKSLDGKFAHRLYMGLKKMQKELGHKQDVYKMNKQVN